MLKRPQIVLGLFCSFDTLGSVILIVKLGLFQSIFLMGY
jgi:hypothetical protein